MQNTIKIKDSALDKIDIQNRLQAVSVETISIPDLAQTGSEKLHATVESPDYTTNRKPNSDYTFVELINNVAIKEPEFTSSVPIIGIIIVKFRQLWNWMSTRWYVLPIIEQQSDVNFQMSITLMEMSQLQTSNRRQIANLETKINDLEKQISQQTEL